MAAIPNVYATETTNQTETSASYVDHLTISAASIVANATYFLFAKAQVGGDNVNRVFQVRLSDGAGEILGSEMIFEPNSDFDANPTRRNNYFYATKYLPGVTPTDIDFQMRVAVSGTCVADSIVLILIRLDADLTEDADWFFSELDDSGAPVQHTTTKVVRATKTFTPGNNNDDWLVFACTQILIDATNVQYEMHMDLDASSEVQPAMSQEGEDNTEIAVETLMRVHTLSDAEHTLAVFTRDDATGVNDHNWSAILGLRLNAFENHDFAWTEAEFTLAAADTYEQLGTDAEAKLTIDFLTAGDIFCFGQGVCDVTGSDQRAGVRIQVDGVTSVTGEDSNTDNSSFDGSDENVLSTIARVNVASGDRDVDLDGEVSATAARIEDRSVCAFSAELAAVPNETPYPEPQPVERLITVRAY